MVPIHNAKPPVHNKHVEKQQIENIRREIAAKCGKATGVGVRPGFILANMCFKALLLSLHLKLQ